ncbi:MAG: FGGY-family carbohydrate kinase [Clostridiaceae bacterium]|nr:FGGY-family carbohydrate kinase [Clostridiaceae bacterium]
MMADRYYLGIDIGTYESKGALIDQTGRCVAAGACPHGMSTPAPGFAEHDAEQIWWGDFCRLSRDIIQRSGIRPDQIKGVGCSTIAPCCLPVGQDGKPLRPAILYGVDVRAAREIDEINRTLGEAAILQRCGNPVTSQSVGPKILWLRRHEPAVYKQTRRFVTGTTYLVAKLTGQWVIDHYTAAYFTPLYHLAANDWDTAALDPYCRPDQLADCRWTDEPAGAVTPQAAEETGLLAGTPVITGTADAAAEAVGAGVFDPGDVMLMFGSSIYMIHVVPKLSVDQRFWAGPYLFQDTWMVAGGMSTAGTLTRWFRDQLARDTVEQASREGVNAYDLLMRDIDAIPPGSDGLIVLPYLSGERTPINDPAASGLIFGLSLGHRREHLYKACLEGVGYGIAQHFSGFQEMGLKTGRIIAVGGGTRNPSWLQIVADISGRPLRIGQANGAAYGDALLAALGTGELRSPDDIQSRIHLGDPVLPDPGRHKLYQPYCRLYRQLYQQNQKSMHELYQMKQED